MNRNTTIPTFGFHKEVHKKLVRFFKEFYPPVILDGQPGTGKTFLAKQVAKEMGYGVTLVNASMNANSAFFEKLIEKATTVRFDAKPRLILLDELENIFSSETQDLLKELVRTIANTGKQTHTMLVATTNNAWKLPKEVQEEFTLIKMKRPTLAVVKRELKKHGLGSLPPELVSRDVRKLVQNIEVFLRSPDSWVADKSQTTYDVSFDVVGAFLKGDGAKRLELMEHGKLRGLRPRLSRWVILNLLGNTFSDQNQVAWHDTIELMSVGDALGSLDKVLVGMPRFEIGFGDVKHPSQIARFFTDLDEAMHS